MSKKIETPKPPTEETLTLLADFGLRENSPPVAITIEKTVFDRLKKKLQDNFTPVKIASGGIIFIAVAAGVAIETQRVKERVHEEQIQNIEIRKKFEGVIERRYQQVLNFLEKKLGDPQAAGDLTQEIFIRAYNAYPKFSPDPKLDDAEYSWIMQIAYNRLLNYIRDTERKKIVTDYEYENDKFDSDYSMMIADSSQQTEENNLDYLDSEERILAAIDSLADDNWKLILYLRSLEKMTLEDIAIIMNTSEGAIKAQLHRIRGRLSKHMQDKEGRGNLP